MAVESEYLSSVRLMILGESLDPEQISVWLKMQPNQAWIKGKSEDPRHSNHYHEWGGWKKSLPEALKLEALEEQISYWLELLKPNRDTLLKIGREQDMVGLDCFVVTDETASIIFSPELLKAVADFGLELRLSFSVNN